MVSRAAARFRLLTLLEKKSPTVVALTGPWGAGKTHLWHEIEDVLRERNERLAYVSLFGMTTMAELHAAILSAAFAPRPRDEVGLWANAKQKISNQLPAILQVIDNKIGAPLLARIVSPVVLLPEESVVCIDDLERASPQMDLAQVLGLANVLCESRKSRIILIYNDEHVRERERALELDQRSALFERAYRERAIRQSVKLAPNIDELMRVVLGEFDALPDAVRQSIKDCFVRSQCQNIRTFRRIVENVSQVREALGEYLEVPHLVFTCALTIEHAEGSLQPFEFYKFHPISFLFSRQRGVKEPPTQEELARSAFYARHYPVPILNTNLLRLSTNWCLMAL